MSTYFLFNARLEQQMSAVIGPDRLAPYLDAAGNSRDAILLYTWNSAIASAFLGPISIIEIALRNVIANRLTATSGRPGSMMQPS
jgi:hypothetical protein